MAPKDALMSPRDLLRRRWLHVIFGLFLAGGLTVGAYFVWAVADWIRPQGEGAFGLLFVGAVSFVPAILGWLAGGVYLFLVSRDRDVRLGVALTTAHIVWWALVIGVGVWGKLPSWKWAMRFTTIAEPGLYAVGVTVLAARWFWWRRDDGPMRAAA
jgi:hypothetical protein